MVFLDHAIALGGRWEIETHSQPRPAAKILENDRHGMLHRLDVFTTAVMKDDAFGRHDFVVGDPVLIIAAVGSVHDEPPDATWTHIEAVRGDRKAVRPPPLRKMLGIGPNRENEIARRVEFTDADDRARVGIELEAIFFGHVFHPWSAVLSPGASLDR